MLASIPSRLLSEWMAYERLEPFDSADQADLRAGLIAALIYNTNRAQGQAAIGPGDIFPRLKRLLGRRRGRRQSLEQQMQAAMKITALLGGEVRGGQP